MKKMLLILLMAASATVKCFSQGDNSSKDIAAQGKPDTTKCTNLTTVTLDFETCPLKIDHQSQFGLTKKGSYVFRIQGVNDALFTSKVVGSNITRAVTIPATAAALIPVGNVTAGLTNYRALIKKPGTSADLTETKDYYFVERYNYDFNILQLISTDTKALSNFLNQNSTDIKGCRAKADGIINDIQTLISNSQNAIVGSAADLQHFTAKQNNMVRQINDLNISKDTLIDRHKQIANLTEAIAEAKTYTGVSGLDLNKLDDFKAFLESTLVDFTSRYAIINLTDRDLYKSLTYGQLNQIRSNYTLVQDDLKFLKISPEIINSVQKCNLFIDSKAFNITSDYLQLNVTLLRPKFGDKPDTVLTSKLNFYRVNYWKWIDASAGFFYDNLASKAYYFSNTVPKAEIKSQTDFSVGALIHSYYVASSWFKVGPCVGAGVSLLDGKSKYLGGISLIFGRNNEWAFSGGIAVASLPQISNVYQSGTTTSTTTTTTTTTTVTTGTTTPPGGVATPNPGTTVTTVATTGVVTTAPVSTTGAVSTYNKYQTGYFFGLTYSFLKL